MAGRLTLQLGMLAATLMAICGATSGASAYTAEQEQACTGDAFRVCGSAIPDVGRVTACMIANQSQLSPGCRAFFRPVPVRATTGSIRAGQPLRIQPGRAGKPRKAVAVRRAKRS